MRKGNSRGTAFCRSRAGTLKTGTCVAVAPSPVLQERGYLDARLQPDSHMSAGDIKSWTAAIDSKD